MALTAVGLPSGALAALCSSMDGLFVLSGGSLLIDACSKLRFQITSGVPQGCPGSGFSFVVVIDPLLQRLDRRIDSCCLGFTTACADDVAGVAFNIHTATLYNAAFFDYKAA